MTNNVGSADIYELYKDKAFAKRLIDYCEKNNVRLVYDINGESYYGTPNDLHMIVSSEAGTLISRVTLDNGEKPLLSINSQAPFYIDGEIAAWGGFSEEMWNAITCAK